MIYLEGNKKNVIILDVEATQIHAGFFSYSVGTSKVIEHELLAYETKNLYHGSLLGFDRFYAETLKGIESVLEVLIKKTLLPFEGVYINLSSPWASSQKKTLEYHSETSFVLTQEIIDTLIKKEQEQSLDQNLDFFEHGVKFLERNTISTYVNGYKTLKPLGETAKDIIIHSLMTVISEQTHRDFSHAVERVTHRQPLFISNMWTRFSAFQKKFPNQNEVIIVDVAGTLTEVVVVRNDEITQIGSFPVGLDHIVKQLAEYKGISFEKSLSFLKNVNEGILSDNESSVLRKSFSLWLKEAYRFFDELSKEGLLPDTFGLSLDNDFFVWFSEMVLSSEEISEHIHARKNISLLPYFTYTEKKEELSLVADFLINNHIKI